mmetsp:Transcript_62124/g.106689  ORF Transcript_62124/g.106689 Transcript_62124/m.106689 type:complete len:414 (+) Transcript_62124:55-1296(+)
MFPQCRMFFLALALRTGFTSAEKVWTREVFAVTNEAICGEDLPFGDCGATPLTKDSDPFFCMNFKDTLHDAFTQEFFVDDVLQFTIEWEFVSGRKTLKERFINAESTGETVKWHVQTTSDFFDDGEPSFDLEGVWKFSSNAHFVDRTFEPPYSGSSGFSSDDACWGAGNGVLDAALQDYEGSLSKTQGWGQENSDSTDGFMCAWWYAEGEKQTGANSIKNVLYWKRSEENEDDGDNQGTCFHGATHVTFEDKTTKAMTELQVGDKIQTADIHGNLDFAPIISLPHKAGNSEMATFLKIVTDSGKSVQMTPGHLIPNCAGKMFSAKEVVVGDCVMTVDGKETVTEITSATHFGVYTAVTAHALIVASGIIASPFSVENDPRRQQDNVGTSSFLVNFLNTFFGKVSTGLRGAKAE